MSVLRDAGGIGLVMVVVFVVFTILLLPILIPFFIAGAIWAYWPSGGDKLSYSGYRSGGGGVTNAQILAVMAILVGLVIGFVVLF